MKVLFIFFAAIVVVAYTAFMLANGLSRIDLSKTVVICDQFSPDKKATTREFQLSSVKTINDFGQFNNFNYDNFIKDYSDEALQISSACNGAPDFTGEDAMILNASHSNHIFEIQPAYSYLGYIWLIIGNLLILIGLAIIRGCFYYIALGKFWPKK
jgi:hypothetical protein